LFRHSWQLAIGRILISEITRPPYDQAGPLSPLIERESDARIAIPNACVGVFPEDDHALIAAIACSDSSHHVPVDPRA
jgi:hypothetical protein